MGREHDFRSRDWSRDFGVLSISNTKTHVTSNDARWRYCLGRGKARMNNGGQIDQAVVNKWVFDHAQIQDEFI